MDYEAEHRKLWDLIIRYFKCDVNNLPRNSMEWLIVKKGLLSSMGYNSLLIVNTCFACAYVVDNSQFEYVKCNYCPLKWHRGICGNKHSEYDDFTHALYSGERSKAIELAECIRDLPWED